MAFFVTAVGHHLYGVRVSGLSAGIFVVSLRRRHLFHHYTHLGLRLFTRPHPERQDRHLLALAGNTSTSTSTIGPFICIGR